MIKKYIKCYSKFFAKILSKKGFHILNCKNGVFTFLYDEELFQKYKKIFNFKKMIIVIDSIDF